MLAFPACSLALPAAEGMSPATRSTLAGDCRGKCVIEAWLMASCLALMPACLAVHFLVVQVAGLPSRGYALSRHGPLA